MLQIQQVFVMTNQKHGNYSCHTGTETRGTITKNNELGSIIKDDKQQFTCADRAIKKAGSVNHPNILNTNFSALASQSLCTICTNLVVLCGLFS